MQHGVGKASPWRVKGTPLGPGFGPSQAPDSEDINAAMAAVGDLAACFPSTQAEPDANAAAVTADPTAPADHNQAQADAEPGQAQQSTAEPDSADQHEDAAAAASGSRHATSASADTAQPEAATGAHSRHLDSAPQGSDADQGANPDEPEKAADLKKGSKRKQPSAPASADADNLGGQGSGRGRGRGRGRASGVRGGGQARGRGRKRSKQDTLADDEAAASEVNTEQPLATTVGS